MSTAVMDSFLSLRGERLPTAREFVALCEELNIRFSGDPRKPENAGRPVMKTYAENREIALLISTVISREPWRSQVIAQAGITLTVDVAEAEETPHYGPLVEAFLHDISIATPARLDELGRQLVRLKSEAATDAERDVAEKMGVLFIAGKERRKVLEETT